MEVQKKLMQAIELGNTAYFYTSRTWRRKRKQILARDNNECQECKLKGGFSIATDVHHIKHLKARPDLALSDDNLISLCATCHNYNHPEKLWQPEEKVLITQEKW